MLISFSVSSQGYKSLQEIAGFFRCHFFEQFYFSRRLYGIVNYLLEQNILL